MNNRVTYFEIPTDKPVESMAFFQKVFGWVFERFGTQDYWFAKTGDEKSSGINGAIMKKKDPEQPLVNTISVIDLDKTITDIEAAGGTIVVPRMTVLGVGWMAYFKDLDGNIHGIAQLDKNAK